LPMDFICLISFKRLLSQRGWSPARRDGLVCGTVVPDGKDARASVLADWESGASRQERG
jgi:hypothetical protein